MEIISDLLLSIQNKPLTVDPMYLDPGSGSILIQLILGAAVGIAFAIRAYWGKIKSFFIRSNDQPEDDE